MSVLRRHLRRLSPWILFQAASIRILILWIAGIVCGLAYLVLPGHIFLTLLAGGLIVVLGLAKPGITFCLMVLVFVEEMVQFFATFANFYEVRFYPYLIPLLATTAGLTVRVAFSHERIRRTPVDLTLIAIIAFQAVSMLWAPSPGVGALLVFSMMLNFLLFAVPVNILTGMDILRKVVATWIFAGIVAATAVILSQWIDVSSTVYLSKTTGLKFAFQEQVSRPAGLAGVDHVAGFISTAFFFALSSMVWETRGKVKVLYLLMMAYMIYAMILTLGRGPLIGLAVGYLFFILIHSHFKGKVLRTTFLFFVALATIVLIARPGYIDRMLIGFGYTGTLYFSEKETYHGTEATTESGQGLSGMEMRKIWWVNALREMKRHPLKMVFGLGVGGFLFYSQGSNTVPSPEVNSIIFSFFYDMGVFGLVLLIFLAYVLVSNIHYCLKNSPRDRLYYILLGWTAAFIAEPCVHGLIDFDLTSYGAKFFWFPIGIMMALLNLVRRSIEEERMAAPGAVPGGGELPAA